ncbi:hypothetical protein BDW59DRAFT_72429 [Aspergillus cavernicola]|uniref:Uncharacterized protein n=1 Tax=Aspergillus cavernicola TaxID=176166 RepID=A0ABR4ICE0_9EURO
MKNGDSFVGTWHWQVCSQCGGLNRSLRVVPGSFRSPLRFFFLFITLISVFLSNSFSLSQSSSFFFSRSQLFHSLILESEQFVCHDPTAEYAVNPWALLPQPISEDTQAWKEVFVSLLGIVVSVCYLE